MRRSSWMRFHFGGVAASAASESVAGHVGELGVLNRWALIGLSKIYQK